MGTNVYEKKIEELLAGKINELIVQKEDFFTFRDVWINHPKKNQLEAQALLGGKVVYRKTDQ